MLQIVGLNTLDLLLIFLVFIGLLIGFSGASGHNFNRWLAFGLACCWLSGSTGPSVTEFCRALS